MNKRPKNKYPSAQKQESVGPSLQPSLRRHTLAFFAMHLLLIWFIFIDTYGQSPVINTPQPATVRPNVINGSNNNMSVYVQPQNQSNGLDVYEQDRRESQQQDPEKYKQLYGDYGFSQISYDLPSLSNEKGTEYYEQAFKKLDSMLDGKEPMSIKQAVFAVENAYFENKLDYTQYEKVIYKFDNH